MKKEEALAKKERAEARQQDISRNLLKLDQWKKDITSRKEKKELVSEVTPSNDSRFNSFNFRTRKLRKIAKTGSSKKFEGTSDTPSIRETSVSRSFSSRRRKNRRRP